MASTKGFSVQEKDKEKTPHQRYEKLLYDDGTVVLFKRCTISTIADLKDHLQAILNIFFTHDVSLGETLTDPEFWARAESVGRLLRTDSGDAVDFYRMEDNWKGICHALLSSSLDADDMELKPLTPSIIAKFHCLDFFGMVQTASTYSPKPKIPTSEELQELNEQLLAMNSINEDTSPLLSVTELTAQT